jgi:hypothetical protein
MTEKYYYQLYLQIVLRGADYVFGYINVSRIPYEKFYELFQDQVTTETFLFDDVSYFIDTELYQKINDKTFHLPIPATHRLF